MDKNTEVIKSLNQLIQGEYMSVKAFNIFISKLKDENVKKAFQEIQDQHRENIQNLVHYIQELGGQPDENTGMKGTMAEIRMNMETSSDIAPSDYIKKAIEGMIKGINKTEELLRGDLDDSSRNLVGEVLQKDRQSVEKLRSLI